MTSPLAIRSASDVGLLRKNNEDYLLVRAEGRPLLGVFDGMGGHPDGEVASRMAADTVADFIRRFEKTYQHPEPMLIDAMRAANEACHRYNPRMGTTGLVAFLNGLDVHLAHVGDSRAYYMDETGFRAVTKDHVGWGGGLTNYIGQNPASEVIVDTPSVRMKPGSTLILCSDGLTNMVEEGDIYNLLTASADPQPLIDAAKAKGGVDNITLITVTWKST